MRPKDISRFEQVRKKRESLYLLLVLLSEASRIAYWSRTATQKPTLEYVTIAFSFSSSRSFMLNTLFEVHIHGHLPLLHP